MTTLEKLNEINGAFNSLKITVEQYRELEKLANGPDSKVRDLAFVILEGLYKLKIEMGKEAMAKNGY